MKCMACKQADTRPGTTTVTLERNGATLVFKDVPAEVCPNCGEDYVDEAVTRALMQSAEDMVASGAQVDIRKYAAAVCDAAAKDKVAYFEAIVQEPRHQRADDEHCAGLLVSRRASGWAICPACPPTSRNLFAQHEAPLPCRPAQRVKPVSFPRRPFPPHWPSESAPSSAVPLPPTAATSTPPTPALTRSHQSPSARRVGSARK